MAQRQTPIGPNPSDSELRELLHDYLFLKLGSEPQQRAFDDVVDTLGRAPEDGWRLIEIAAGMSLTDEQSAYFAAGPVEDLLGWNGEAFIDRLEAAALYQEGFRAFVAGVWQGQMTDAIWRRILALQAKLDLGPL